MRTSPGRSVTIRLHAERPVRRSREPVTIGLPWPKGVIRNENDFRLTGASESELLQAHCLDRWADGSIRWCLFDFFATTDGVDYHIDAYSKTPQSGCTAGPDFADIRFDDAESALTLRRGQLTAVQLNLRLLRDADAESLVNIQLREIQVEGGHVRKRIHFSPRVRLPDGLELSGFIDLYAGHSTARLRLSLRNTRPCSHPGGTWDLGNPGSSYIRELSLTLCSTAQSDRFRTYCTPEACRLLKTEGAPVDLYQASSGGQNWNNHNHLDRNRKIPLPFRGYRLASPAGVMEGLRSTPIVMREAGEQLLAVAVPRFWQNFPQRIRSNERGLTLELLPTRDGFEHELMGGEQKTWDFYLAFGADEVSDPPFEWCRDPLLAHADPVWYSTTGAIPYLSPAATDRNAVYRSLVDQAIEGPNNFFEKREAIDEYGWRHFGDVYADHEAVFHKGSERLVSHYNNQFDFVNGCAVQFLRSADRRWWQLLIPAADHTCDIDTYHTTGDKGAYNGGLFPFTFHYFDADTSGHRGYPRVLQNGTTESFERDLDALGATGEALKRAIARGLGGGPSASHIYNQGLMLSWFLTGVPQYRDEAVGQAEYILRMDRPSPLLRLLSSEYSGGATPSGSSDYHGPGRASANSILALLVGHRLTGRREFLEKAEQLIRRVSHPRQNLKSLDLLNAELRWFYVMHLQALGAYLDHKAELGEIDAEYAYARFTLLHYARWMAVNERPFLSRKEQLQYPTETWPAQDMRKVEAFQYAAKHAEGAEKELFLERADWFFHEIVASLSGFETRSLCRPVNLMMNFGWSRSWWQAHPDTQAPVPAVDATPDDFGDWTMFVPQRRKAVRRFKLLAALFCAAAIVGGLLFAFTS